MTDPRYTKLAQLLVNYSTTLKKGDRILLDMIDVPDEFTVELIRAVRAAGATPFVETRHTRVGREMLLGITESQAADVRDLEMFRMKKMQAAQIDSRGGRMINVDAAVAHSQLNDVLTAVISSSLKVCEYSLVVTIRPSIPVVSRSDLEEAQRELNRRRERVIHAVGRMNGARAIPESLAQRRLLLSSLPGMAGPNQREMSALTLHAADLLPIETPWRGTMQSPLILLETPYRQLIPFSPYDSSMGDANMLFMAKSGGGKTFMARLAVLDPRQQRDRQ